MKSAVYFSCIVHLLMLFNFPAESSALSSATLINDLYTVKINLQRGNHNFGTVSAFSSNDFKENIDGIHWFRLHAGTVYPSESEIIAQNQDTLSIILSGFGSLPLKAVVCYVLKENVLHIDARFWVTATAEFSEGLSFDIESPTPPMTAEVLTPNFKRKKIECSNSIDTYSDLNPVVFFKNDNTYTTFLIRNPFHSFWSFSDERVKPHQIDILKCLNPLFREPFNLPPSPTIISTISPGDTIFRHIEVSLGPEINDLFFWGEHKNGQSQSITMFFDELPGPVHLENWHHMTTSSSRDVLVDHYLLRLLEEHPKAKLGYLLIPDRLLVRQRSSIAGWYLNSPFIIPDSLFEYADKWCVNMIPSADTIRYEISQTVPCRPNHTYTFSYFLKTMSIQTGDRGAFSEVHGSSGTVISSVFADPGTADWHQVTLPISTGPSDTTLTLLLGVANTLGQAWFDGCSLSDSPGGNCIVNGGFERNNPFLHYTDQRRNWVDARGRENILDAPASYHQFLQRIENDSMLYGWENRVNIGCHGYHHTPSLHQPDNPAPGWEFQHFDPENDRLRMTAIYDVFQKIGLTKKSLRYWRTPGISYTKSIVDLLVDSGVVFMDPYFTSDSKNVRSIFIERNGKRLWLPDLTFWADYQSGFTLDRMREALKCGHLGHFGGHPLGIFTPDSEVTYQTLHTMLKEFETEYPNLGYVFPDEYADNANNIYNLQFGNITQDNQSLSIEIKGRIAEGTTLAFYGNPAQARLNSEENLEIKKDGYANYIILPASKTEQNVLSIIREKKGHNNFDLNDIRPIRTKPVQQKMAITLFTVKGQKIAQKSLLTDKIPGLLQIRQLFPAIAKGTYICSVQTSRKKSYFKVTKY